MDNMYILIRRMTFPADITVTVCSPINTESQLIDYNNICRHFASMDSHYISGNLHESRLIFLLQIRSTEVKTNDDINTFLKLLASIEIPLTSELAKQITVRTTRDDFIARHCLVSLRWDENSLRKDSCNPSLCSLSMDEISASGMKENFPRLRSASESRREDGLQLGVAKLWATKVQTMRTALDLLCSAGGVVTSISMGDNFQDDESKPVNMLPLSAATITPSASQTTPTIHPSMIQAPFRAGPPALQLVPSIVSIQDYTATPSVNEVYPTINSTIDTPQGPKDIKFEGSHIQHYLNTPPTYSAFPSLRAKTSESPRIQSHDSSTKVSENSVSHFDFDIPTFSADSIYLPQDNPSLQSSGVIESLAKQNQAAKDAIKFKEVDLNTHKAIYKQKIMLQPMAQRLSNQQFDPSIYVPAPSLYNRPTNLHTNLIDFCTPQQSPAVQDRFAIPQRSFFQSFDGTASRIKAAPGLTLPTDWDELFQKVENRTPPSSNIPKAMAPSPTSINFSLQHLGVPINRFSPKSSIENKQTFSLSGFNSHAISPPSSAFTPVPSKDRGPSASARCKEDFHQKSGASQIPALSQDQRYFNAEHLQKSADVISATFQTRRGSGTYRDGGTYREAGTYCNTDSPARRMSLGAVNTADSSLRLCGLYGAESSGNGNLHHIDTSPSFDASQFLYISQQLQQQQQLRSHHNMALSRIVVHWPHPSLRFMFLGDPLKYQLGDMLHRIRSRGIGVMTPVREKSSPSACLFIEGECL